MKSASTRVSAETRAPGRQRGLEPLLTLARLAAGVGEGEDRPGQPQHRGGVAGAQRPGHGRVQVGPLDRQALDPGRRTRDDEMRLGLLRQSEVIGRVGRAGRVLLPARGQSLQIRTLESSPACCSAARRAAASVWISRLCSTSARTPSRTSQPISPAPDVTAATASRPPPPASTARRRKNACSSAVSRS